MLRLSARALRDLDQIRLFVAERSMLQSIVVMDRLHSEFGRLERMPRIGRSRGDLSDPGLRSWVVFDYLVLYRVVDDEVRVVRVVHGHMDLRQMSLDDNDWPDSVREARSPWGLAAAG